VGVRKSIQSVKTSLCSAFYVRGTACIRPTLLLIAGRAAIDRYLLPTERTAANLRQTDGRTRYRFIELVSHTTRAAPITDEVLEWLSGWSEVQSGCT